MKASELRIGNYVTYNPSSVDEGTDIVPLKVISIDLENGVKLDDGFDNWYGFDEILPIHLTEDMLKSVGFVYDGHHLVLDVLRCGKIIWMDDGSVSIGDDYATSFASGRVVVYVHQLQNLIHALTGEELKIEL